MIKVIKYIFTVLIIFSVNILGQSFSISLDESAKSDTIGAEIVFYFEVINTTQDELTLFFTKTKLSSPDEWSASLCITQCFRSDFDSIATTNDYNELPLNSGDTLNVSFHVFALNAEGTGQYKFKAGNLNNPGESNSFDLTAIAHPTGIEKNLKINKFDLKQNYPNPFNPTTTIQYSVPNNASFVSLTVYSILGVKIVELVNEVQQSGSYEVNFNAANLASGIYFYRLQISDAYGGNNFMQVRKMIMEK